MNPAHRLHRNESRFRYDQRAQPYRATEFGRSLGHRDPSPGVFIDYHYWEARGRRLQAQAIAGALRRACNAVRSLLEAVIVGVRRWRTERATIAALSPLSDRTLKDIGVWRHDIPRLAREVARETVQRDAQPGPEAPVPREDSVPRAHRRAA